MTDVVKAVVGVGVTAAGVLTGSPQLALSGIAMTTSGVSGMVSGSAGTEPGTLSSTHSGIMTNVSSSDAPLLVVYGLSKLAPRIVDARVDRASTDDKDLAWVGAICLAGEDGSGIESVENVYFDDVLAIASPAFEGEPETTGVQAAFSGGLEYGLHAGADAQAVDAELTSRFSGEWGATCEGLGVAYIALFMTFDEEVYPGGIPEVRCEVKGCQVYDPRDDSTAWSDNPALCVLDYLTSKRYGLGAAYSERDGGTVSEIDETSFEAAANYYEESVSIPGGTQQRFRCNGVVNTGASHQQNLNALLSSCASDLVFQGGKFRLVPHTTESAESFELTEDNIIGDFEYERAGIKGTGNSVAVTFVDANAGYHLAETVWPESDQTNTMLTNDSSWEHRIAIDLPFTTDLYMAQQIGMTALRESREDLTVALTAKEEALKLQVGEVVKVTHSTPAWSEKLFRVAAMGINPDATVRIVLREYDVNAYSLDTLNTRDTLVTPDTHDPRSDLLPEITGISVSFDADGTVNVHPIGGPRTANIYVTVGNGSAPSDPTVAVNDGSMATRSGAIETATSSDIGDKLIVKAVAANSQGNLGPVMQQTFRRGDSQYHRFQLIIEQEQDGSTQKFDFTILDPSLSLTGVWFKTKTDAGDYGGSWLTTWDRSTGTPGTNSSLTRGEDVSMHGKHVVGLIIRIGYKDENYNQRYFMAPFTGDPDHIAHAKITQVTVKEDGTVVFAYQGDEDTVGIYYTVDSSDPANEPDDPDNADTYVAGRKGIVTTGTTANHGETVWVKIAGKNSANAVATGDDIDECQKLAILQPPSFTDVECQVYDDGAASYNRYTVDWSINAAVTDAAHRIDIVFYENGSRVGESTGNTPSDGQEIWDDAGAGDGAQDRHHALVQIVDQGTGNPIASVTTRPLLSML